MSLKDLFKNKGKKYLKPTTKSEIGDEIESADLIDPVVADKETFIPHIDFSLPENFARYGSAKKYYTDAFSRITDQFPYDGTLTERSEWFVSSSYIDKWIYENKYPRTNGYVCFSPEGWGTRSSSHEAAGYHLGMPENKEYILIKGGPNVDTSKDYKKEGSRSNIYNVDENRITNLRLNATSGSTVEFWLKVDALPDTGDAGATDRMTVFDLWNGISGSSSDYGRFEIYVNNDGTGSNAAFGIHAISGTVGTGAEDDDSFTGFNSVSASSANEGLFTSHTQNDLSDGLWHHYAIVLKNTGSNLISQLYVDGEKKQTITKSSESLNEIEGKMIACLGANVAYPEFIQDPGTIDSANGRGLSKLSASMDEFRYWKTARTEKQIGRYWFTQVAGGTNKDDANIDLGVYYKFNEGIMGDADTDSTVLDYSGRISNGAWTVSTGMVGSTYRVTGSAIVEAGAASKEYKDPIIYENHDQVKNQREDLEASGSNYDDTNASSIYRSMPDWIVQNDAGGDKHLENLTQVMANYFDTLHLQIEALPRLKDVAYHSGSHKPYPFNDRILENFGFNTADMFYDEDFLENFDQRDDDRVFKETIHNVKNTIYNNIYNNLIYIYKSKGTEKSFRNLIRCFGVDEEFIKLNVYANNTTYTLGDSYRETAVNKTLINFSSGSNHDDTGTTGSVVYQYTEAGNSNSTSYIYGSADDSGNEVYVPITTEAEVYFPLKASSRSTSFISHPHYSSSLFGCRTAEEDSDVYTVADPDYANFTVYSVRKELDEPGVYFQLTGTYVPDITSSFFEDVYDNEKWNFGVRFRLEKEPWSNEVSGTYASGSDNDVMVEFYGVNTEAGVVKRDFAISGTLDDAANDYLFSSRKRFFAGADRTNFTGDVLTPSDVKFSSLRHWVSNVDDNEIRAHALDIKNYGVREPFRSAHLFETSTEGIPVPKIETLALNWDFNNITGSDGDGEFLVADVSSGSATLTDRYGWLGNSLKKQHTARGYGFPPEKKGVVAKTYISTLKQTIPENMLSSEMVKVLAFDDEIFTRDSRPVNYFFAFEKSPYQNISEEMLNIFATIKDFNNLIGEPVNRYRQKYKDLEKLRNLFFERVQNTPDVEKYISFYKWLDSSISDMLRNLFPASADFAEDVRTIIESHVLERNKYWTKFPTMEFKTQDPEASMKGASELNYDWKHGHAPISQNEADNCLWWKKRAERDRQAFDDNSALASGDDGVDSKKNDILQVLVTETSASNPKLAKSDGTVYQGSSYAMRSLTRPYKFKAEAITTNRASDENKKSTLWKTETGFSSDKSVTILSTSVIEKNECNDKLTPHSGSKHKYSFEAASTGDSSYLDGNGELLAPFSIISSSVTKGYVEALSTFKSGVEIVNHHVDSYYGEEPLQGPFTEKYVGGQQHRHVDINYASPQSLSQRKDLDTDSDRPEAYHLSISSGQLTVQDPSDHHIEKPRARYFRDETAKRPVNIRNIKQTTGSLEGSVTVIGNYEHNYQVVQAPGRNVNNLWFRSGSTGAGGVDTSTKLSDWVSGTVDFRLPDRSEYSDGTRNKTVIAERFSSPGGPEQMGRGYLDVETETYSIYNTMNYRNMIVREFVDEHSSKMCEQFGLLKGTTIRTVDASPESGEDDSYINDASWHKVNRNTRYRLEAGQGLTPTADEDDGQHVTGAVHDNAFVRHMIPQSDRQYAWITASLADRANIGKSAPFGYSMTQDGLIYNAADDSWNNPFTWVTQSDFGSYTVDSSTQPRIFGTTQEYWETTLSASVHRYMPGNFAGINTHIYEPIDEANNLIGTTERGHFERNDGYPAFINAGDNAFIDYQVYSGFQDASGTAGVERAGAESAFNTLMLHRNGPGGYPTWKQVRTARHPVARHMRRNNRLSVITSGKTRGSAYSWPDNLTPTPGTSERTMTSYTEPVVSFKSKPMIHSLLVDADDGDGNITLKHTYANNLTTYANNELVNKTNSSITEKQAYDHLVDLYTPRGGVPFELNPIKKMKAFTYSETVFPKDEYVGLAKTRMRLKYSEDTGSTGDNGIDRRQRRTFWRDKRSDRGLTVDSSENSQGHVDMGQGRPSLTGTQLNIWPLGPAEYGEVIRDDLSPYSLMRETFFGELWPSGTYESLHTTASLSFMRSLATPSTGAASHGFTYGHEPSTKMPLYSAHIEAGKNPWYDSYEDYSADIKLIGQGYSILPEFRISDHMDYYIESGGNFLKTNNKILSLDGTEITSSATDELAAANKEFYETYSHSDFMQYFGKISDDHQSSLYRPSKISLKFSGIKKLLPYNGFYPALRSVQLGSLLSQSLGPYIGGSEKTGSQYFGGDQHDSEWAGVGNVDEKGFSPQRLNAMLQPLMAPGVFFNSIKSGIAVDYPVFSDEVPTDATAAANAKVNIAPVHLFVPERPNYRIPFESLVDLRSLVPQNSKIYYNDPQFVGSSEKEHGYGDSNPSFFDPLGIYMSWDGELHKPQFEMATNNFLGETVKFFLKGQKLKSFKSSPQKDFKTMASGNTYYMDIVLWKTEDFVLSQGGALRSIGSSPGETTAYGSIYGPPYRGHQPDGTGDDHGFVSLSVENHDPHYAPHTPPYFYGKSTARISFIPHEADTMGTGESRQFSLSEILAGAEITYFNEHELLNKLAAEEATGLFTGSLDGESLPPSMEECMELSSSLNLFGIERRKKVEFKATQTGQEENENSYIPIKIFEPDSDEYDSWVISPKWECPTVNVSSSNAVEKTNVLSIWNKYGQLPEENSGIFLEIKESYPEIINMPRGGNALTRSLAQVCGFESTTQRIGEIADEKEISEAIVAIPYSTTRLKGLTVQKKGFGNKHFYRIEKEMFNIQRANVEAGQPAIKEGQKGSLINIEETSISKMIRTMKKYVIPPRLDFLKIKKSKGPQPVPIAMYFFEFTHTLDQEDLSDIWQNLMPKIAMKAEKQDVVVSHDVSMYDFFGVNGGPFNPDSSTPNVRWMIFKVKRKAEQSYYSVTADTTDDDRFKFDFGGKVARPDYSYNWPYDFFSLVELAKLDTAITFEPKPVASVIKPPISPNFLLGTDEESE